MIDILTIVPGKKSLSQSGWYSFNAICCQYRGHRADTRKRGGIKLVDNGWSFHCFNCGFKAGFFIGKSITKNARQLLTWSGVDEAQINRWNVERLQQKDLFDYSKKVKEKKKIKFTVLFTVRLHCIFSLLTIKTYECTKALRFQNN